MEITSQTGLMALIGDPVGHSKSPDMMNRAFQEMGLSYVYVAFQVKPHELRQAVEGLRALGVKGFNVTIPHKVEVMETLDELDASAREIGAVNMVMQTEGKWVGFNTDGMGYLRSLKEELNPDLKRARVILLGAGGAARAVGYALAQAGVESLTIANRTVEKAEALAEHLGRFTKTDAVPLGQAERAVKEATLVVNTTSVGMHPHVDETPIPIEWMHEGQIASDLIYVPRRTAWLQGAEARGAHIHAGMGMLIHQAAIAIEHWFQRKAPVPIMKEALIQSLSQPNAEL